MKREQLHTYFIMGSENCDEPLHVLEQALQAGVTCFQLREKNLTGEARLQFAKACQALCQRYAVPFIVNDDVALAVQLQADGVHVGQDDLAAAEASKQLPHGILGVSAHNEAEIAQAIADGADYVGIGPIFATTSKADAKTPCGTTALRAMHERFPSLPKVAIGGITPANARVVRATGVDGVAVISAIAGAPDILAAVKAFNL
ncbi:Thiamine-phosphate synthase [Metalysinibacillus saudimassiliensis]|uniref:Thiamine-phosphate synthase n=1 Tax=Metalysinibacillus saudimassiliensis TaxID=1461583 RepID=A0A078M6R2_9BACL|nr:Thiamine-phosphate synthase [Metalysinibacillus saudimassiliensis]